MSFLFIFKKTGIGGGGSLRIAGLAKTKNNYAASSLIPLIYQEINTLTETPTCFMNVVKEEAIAELK